MTKNYKLKAITRDRFGKGEMHRLRSEGRVPGVVYGPKDDSLAISLDTKEVSHLLQRVSFENTVIQLDITGKVKKSLQTIIREVQQHPYRAQIQHLDFYSVAKNRPVTVEVPIMLHGSPVGVRTQGGLVQHVLRDLEISVLPANIPEHIVVDITDLNIHESIHVEEIPKGDYEILTDPGRTVVTVVPPVIHKEPEPVEAEVVEGEEAEEMAEAPAAEEEETEPEVIGRQKEREKQ
jgi:large subunit ribosomal protein L25